MPVIQIDKNGFIKGTNKKYIMKVITLQSIMLKGVHIPKGDKVELEGNDLAYFLNRGLVAPVKVDNTKEAPQTLEAETQPAIIAGKEKKLGPKKKA
jgi:hypothetical protein